MLPRPEVIFAILLGLLSLFIALQLQIRHSSPPLSTQQTDSMSSPSSSPTRISTPYDETIIVDLVRDIYNLLIKFGSLESTQIKWAPPEGHTVNEELCRELNMDSAVISLIRKLPYPWIDPAGGLDHTVHLIYESEPVRYMDDDQLRESREDLLPHDVMLSRPVPADGMVLILDTKANTIRHFRYGDDPGGPYLERPDDEWNYRNFLPEHAPTWLRRWIARVTRLEMIPNPFGWNKEYASAELEDLDPEDAAAMTIIKKALTERYGWPDNFRRSEYLEEGEELWRSAYDETDS